MKQLEKLRVEVREAHQAQKTELRRYQLQLGRLSRAVDRLGVDDEDAPRLATRAIPVEPPETAPLAWDSILPDHPDPEARQWRQLEACAVCGGAEFTIVNPWNKLLLLAKAPDDGSARYDYAICHCCGFLFATRRPFGDRYRFMLEHFGEVTAKRGGAREISNPMLNPYPLSDADRERLRLMLAKGVFVSDHLAEHRGGYVPGLWRDRFHSSGHVDLLGELLRPRGARVLEVRVKSGAMLDGLRRHWGCDVAGMPIWESQQFIARELYGIPMSEVIDFERFSIPFDGEFDLIICQHMLTHVLDPRAFLGELRRKLTPGGHIYLHNEPDDGEFLYRNQSMIATLNPLHLQAFDQESLIAGLAANGFETVFYKNESESHLILARRAETARPQRLTAAARQRRIERYQMAHDRAILRLDEGRRGRVADQWEGVVARAVASGIAEFDERGRLRLVAH
ncbi:MAG: class I SAM-dependent methyltransferase [Vicinamibacterales bacterium]